MTEDIFPGSVKLLREKASSDDRPSQRGECEGSEPRFLNLRQSGPELTLTLMWPGSSVMRDECSECRVRSQDCYK